MRNSLAVMLIEDNDDHAELVAAAISQSKLPCALIRFPDAEAAIAYLFSPSKSRLESAVTRPDLILLDLALPGLSGLDFLKRIRSDSNTAAIPVIVLTTSNLEEEVAAAYRAGANSYIVKPARTSDFVVKLAEMNMYWSQTAEVPEVVIEPDNS